MTHVSSRVKRLFDIYVEAFVNTRWQLRDEHEKDKAYRAMQTWIADHYQDVHRPSKLEWTMGECRAVTAEVQRCVEEMLKVECNR